MSVYDADAPRPDAAVWSGRIPVLGICYGAQLMALELGGDVLPTAKREYGPATVTITSEDGLFTGLDRDQPVWMSHGDSITRLPEGFRSTAQTDSTPFAGLVDPSRSLYGIQFHPEVVHTPRGRDVLRNFVVGIAGARPTWTPANFIESTVAEIRARVDAHAREVGSDGLVICALSGGVDSAVAAALVHRAVGDRLTCIYVDHGLMRKKESELLRATFEQNLGMRLVMVDARERFLARLAGVVDPEQKRRIIGDEFIRVFEEEAAKLGRIDFLTQGTLYPDVIESATSETKTAQKIKTHHNVGGLPADLRFKLIEPLRYLFKDEVRVVGAELGLPDAMVQRQPFPGPGPGDPDHRRGHRGAARDAARRGLDRHRRDQGRRALSVRLAVVRDPHPGPLGRGHGRRPDLRQRRRHPGRHLGRRDDRRLGQAALRRPRQDQLADRQRGRRGQPGRLRHQLETARHDRVGVGRIGGSIGRGDAVAFGPCPSRPTPPPAICPWCSAELPDPTAANCPSCNANLAAALDSQVPGVTAVDVQALALAPDEPAEEEPAPVVDQRRLRLRGRHRADRASRLARSARSRGSPRDAPPGDGGEDRRPDRRSRGDGRGRGPRRRRDRRPGRRPRPTSRPRWTPRPRAEVDGPPTDRPRRPDGDATSAVDATTADPAEPTESGPDSPA